MTGSHPDCGLPSCLGPATRQCSVAARYPEVVGTILRSGHGLYLRVTDTLPPELAAQVDWRIPLFRDGGWRGVLNGQVGRVEIVREIINAIPVTAIIETGTYRGASTSFFCEITDQPVHSVEAVPRFHHYAARRLSEHPNARLTIGDSRSFLTALVGEVESPVFIYLDAHWYDDLPLADELRIIAKSGIQAVILVDDFAVLDDAGYSYDDYGPGRALVPAYLDAIDEISDWARFSPSLHSAEETGGRRGCVVLTHPGLTSEVDQLTTLRRSSR